MRSATYKQLVPVSFMIIASILACSLPGTGGDQAGELTPTGSTPAALEESTPSPAEPTATIAHTDFPAEPSPSNNFLTDPSSQALASERRANADSFSLNVYERPFTAEEMDYQPYLDVTRAELDDDGSWFYVTIHLEGSPPEGAEATYAVEIDLNLDGRGDWYIGGRIAPSSDWTTDGAFAYHDANDDVGGPNALRSDAPQGGIDGFEELVFDQGLGDDPDAAWVRRHPSDNNRVQLAFKRSLIQNDNYFMWGVWSDEGMRDAGLLDYHDSFTHDEAGSPAINLAQYPLKALFSVDNTCRWGFGFEPVGNEPGVCFIAPTPTPTPVPPTPTPILPGSISGGVFQDSNGNGVRNLGEAGLGGETVTLGEGACDSSGAGSISTAGNGSYQFNNLQPGTYCVTSTTPNACSWPATTSRTRTVNVGNGENVAVTWFGYQNVPC